MTKKFLSKLAEQSHFKLSNLARQFCSLTFDTIPNYYYTYFMWDILVTSYLAIPEYFTIEKVKVYVSERPPNPGQTIIGSSGFEITVATNISKDAFYSYILTQFKSD